MDLDRLINEEYIIDYEVKDPKLRELINYVLRKIPDEEREDFPMFSLYQTDTTDAEYAFIIPGDVVQVFFNVDMLEDGSCGNDDVKIGVIAHELAHVYLKHPHTSSGRKGLKNEEEADSLASHWGFGKEVKASRRKLGPPT
ncbi:MAG: hypothetical protein D8M57_08970 [Candidatus Scalindua sp. AMX11]|nr:MAG: hypothetical protein DWQ00_00800 [Candidatus Scalindua sp.]NOG83076.1 M48 family metalloprotease [Planctomycetota bacterium]RZV79529.1 MAG: hypothetical protein EX341_10855 [Candidatus Scalindua sp. SCAELEC01]TDE65165.1 MAG: hypothetical protein D8M57_08970 [Candidatus Scalindua sp. AMX11]GJQ58599.1 MAG: hypothetical protein SCALA701_14000 [Candidatus Scalindua sp.]